MHSLEYTAHAFRQLRRLPANEVKRIMAALNELAADPHAARNVKKLQGRDGYRLRIADWRVIYEIHNDRLIILVLEIGQRKEVYR